jgi:hypothetical protein
MKSSIAAAIVTAAGGTTTGLPPVVRFRGSPLVVGHRRMRWRECRPSERQHQARDRKRRSTGPPPGYGRRMKHRLTWDGNPVPASGRTGSRSRRARVAGGRRPRAADASRPVGQKPASRSRPRAAGPPPAPRSLESANTVGSSSAPRCPNPVIFGERRTAQILAVVEGGVLQLRDTRRRRRRRPVGRQLRPARTP